MSSERAIHILVSCLYPNPIIPTCVVTEEPRSCASSPVHVVNSRLVECKYRDFELC